MDYLFNLEKAILFVEKNLREPIRVDEIAKAAGYSYFHFHRMFDAMVGESAGSYLRSRRLSRAADDLIYTDKRIIDIALEYCFDSQEAFSRAFKAAFKLTPGAYRKNRLNVLVGNRKPLDRTDLTHLKQSINLQPAIIDFGGAKIIGMRDKTTISQNKIPELWQRFNPRAGEIENPAEGINGFGICEVDPSFDMSVFNEETEFNEFVGIQVKEFSTIPEGMLPKTLKRGKYAIFTHKGRLDNLIKTYRYIWGTWLINSGSELDFRDDFEYYDKRFLGADNPKSEMDIYIPIK